MRFEEALPKARYNKYIKRKDWLNSRAFTYGKCKDWDCYGFLSKAGCAGVRLIDEDILAEDWEVVND